MSRVTIYCKRIIIMDCGYNSRKSRMKMPGHINLNDAVWCNKICVADKRVWERNAVKLFFIDYSRYSTYGAVIITVKCEISGWLAHVLNSRLPKEGVLVMQLSSFGNCNLGQGCSFFLVPNSNVQSITCNFVCIWRIRAREEISEMQIIGQFIRCSQQHTLS